MHEIPRSSGAPARAALAVSVLAAAFHARSLGDRLTNWDDQYLLENAAFVGPRSLGALFDTAAMGHFMPTTQAVLTAIGLTRLDILGVRLLHLGLLGASAALVALVLHRIRPTTSALACGVAGAAFALHPLVVEPVAWAIGTKDLLATTLALAGLLAWIPRPGAPVEAGAARVEGRPSVPARSVVLGAVALGLALGSKASVVLVPAAIGVVAWRRTGSRNLLGAAAGLSVLAGYCVWFARRAQDGLGVLVDASPADAFHMAAAIAVRNLGRLALPTDLHAFYAAPEASAGSVVLGLGLLAALLLAAVVLLVRAPARPATWIVWWALAAYAPVSGLPWRIVRAEADSYLLLLVPVFGWLIGIAADRGLAWFRAGRVARAAGLGALVVAVLLGSGALSWRQHAVWTDAEALWSHARAAEPDSLDVCLLWASAPVRQWGDPPTYERWFEFARRALQCEDVVWTGGERSGRSLPAYRAMVRRRLRGADVPLVLRDCVGDTWETMVTCIEQLDAP